MTIRVFRKSLVPVDLDAAHEPIGTVLGIPAAEVATVRRGLTGTQIVETVDGRRYRIDATGDVWCDDDGRTRLPRWRDRHHHPEPARR